MRGNVLQQFAGRTTNNPAEAEQDGDGAEDYGAFGWLRGVRDRAVMLELRKKDGSVSAFGYAWLERVEYEPTTGLTLHFTGQRVKLTGRNLNGEVRADIRLLNGLLRHKVPWIQEADEPTAMLGDRKGTIIEQIDLQASSV
jgi:hypothetical protein